MTGGTIAHGVGAGVTKAADHCDVLAVRRERLERWGKHQAGGGAGRTVRLHHHAVGRVEDLQALGPHRKVGGFRRWRHRLEERQGDQGPETAQHRAARERLAREPHFDAVLFNMKGSLFTTARMTDWTR